MKKKLRSEFNPRQYMLAEDFELYYYSDLHFKSVGRHTHPYTEIYLFIEGNVDMEIEGKRFPLKPGSVLVVHPHTPHRAVIRDDAVPYRRFVFWVSERFLDALRMESEDYLYLPDLAGTKKKYIYPLPPLEFNTLQSKVFSLLETIHTGNFGRETQIGLSVRDLLLALGRMIYRQENPVRKKETVSSYQVITDYIHENLAGDLSLDTLSRELFLSKYYIAHLVQENTGISLHQYITKKRLSACIEAIQSGQGISESSLQLGFANYSGFYRAFMKEYGCPPSVYLEEYLPGNGA
ncbi:MAG: helix-turn-helix domain-containing protein [Lachnospiraceae bacterium]|nr:helix-turn-helix domain-containing protein [Lachnospiraceae bacterium]